MSDLQTILSTYFSILESSTLAGKTKMDYRSRIGQLISFIRERKALDCMDVPAEDICGYAREFVQDLRDRQKLSQSTINCFLSAYKHLANASGLEALDINYQRPLHILSRGLTDEQELALCRGLDDLPRVRDKAICLLLLRSGIRLSECQGLNVHDVLLDAYPPSIKVLRGKRQRMIPLSVELRCALSDWLHERERIIQENAGKEEPGRPLFVTRAAQRMSLAALDLVIRRIGWSLHLMLSAQVLRNTFLFNLARSGAARGQISYLGGFVRVPSALRPVR